MTGKDLRNSILQEAIQGRLVPNVLQPGEKTGAELLQDILAERQKKENEEKGKKAKKLSLSFIDEEPWDLPEGWCWARLGDVVDYSSGLWEGKKPPFVHVGVIRNANFTKKFSLSFDNIAYLDVEEKQYLSRKLQYGDIIIEKSGGGENQPVGRPVLFLKTTGEFSFSNFTTMIRIGDKTALLPAYLQQVLVGFYVSGVTIALQSNTTNLRNLDFKGYLALSIPLPPLSIQKAIVEKIEELFPIVDEYDKAAGELKALNEALPDKLRKSVLQEAIHGNLVPNEIPEGEATAQELLQQILKERQDRENKEKGKKAKKLTLSEIEEEPWELPEGWCWCKLGDTINLLSGRDLEPEKYNATNNGIPYITGASNFSQGSIIINRWTPSPVSISTIGDLLITCKGTVGELAFNTIGNIHIARQIMAISAIGIDSNFIQVYLKAKVNDLNAQANGVIPGISRDDILLADFPLPPLSIQKAIVAKIEEVFAAIDKLK